jgi:hypothetical protein
VLDLVVVDSSGRRDHRSQDFQVVDEKQEGKRDSGEAGK